jgi:hypothetical protein
MNPIMLAEKCSGGGGGTIFWPETKTETRAKKMSTALRTPASYLDVSKANILTAKEASLNLLSWDLRTVFTDALLVQSGCVNDSPEDEIRNWKSKNTTRYCDRGISDKNCYSTATDNGVQHCREAVLPWRSLTSDLEHTNFKKNCI